MSDSGTEISVNIRELALKAGFTDCGIAPAGLMSDDASRLRKWLSEGMHAGMKYMETHFEERTDPSLLVTGAKSVIVVLLNYFTREVPGQEENYILSKYARGRDYHKVMRSMLKKLQLSIRDVLGPFSGRAFVDSAPVLERSLAARAGLGWIGKNGNLISPEHGSFVFAGELIVDMELEYGKPLSDRCGKCTKCLTACPTEAIVAPGMIDSRRCISYWTIEHKGAIDESLRGTFRDRIFGCDICQDVCPWNRKPEPAKTEDFQAKTDLLDMTKQDWEELTEDKFNTLFSGSAVKRTGYEGLMRNIRFLKGIDKVRNREEDEVI